MEIRVLPTALSNKIANMAFVCSCLVVFIHEAGNSPEGSFSWWFNETVRALCRLAVPYFFIVSGFFLSRHLDESGWWRRETRKRLRTVLVPYVIWNVVSFSYGVLSGFVLDMKAGIPLGSNVDLSIIHWCRAFGLWPLVPSLEPTWYLRWLMIMVIAAPGVNALAVRFGQIRTLVLFALAYFVGVGCDLCSASFSEAFSLEGLFYFTIGLSLSRLISLERFAVRSWRLALCCWAAAVVMAYGKSYVAANGLWGGSVLHILLIPFAIVGLWLFMPTGQCPEVLRHGTIAVYLLHPFVAGVVFDVLRILYPLTARSDAFNTMLETNPFKIGLTLFAIIGSLILSEGLRRLLPKTSKILFGR